MPSAVSPQTVKLKSQLRLIIERLRNAQRKDTALSIAARREMATLLSQNRETSAKIRVENIIQTDICVEVMEILELYAELLLARANLLDLRDKEMRAAKDSSDISGLMDSGLEEAAAAMIYAAPRLPRDIRELPMVRSLLVERWGKDFAARVNENRDGIVPDKVVRKLKVEAPGEKLVEAYLSEIARTYGVDWPRQEEVESVENLQEEVDDEEEETTDSAPNSGGGGGGDNPSNSSTKRKADLGRPFEREELSRATPPRDIGPAGTKSPVSVAPPGARSDNPSPSVKLPGGGEARRKSFTGSSGGGSGSGSGSGSGIGAGSAKSGATKPPVAAAAKPASAAKNIIGGKIPDVNDLQKRFAALKR